LLRGAGKDVALFNVDGTIYAMGDSCLHEGWSLAARKLDGKTTASLRRLPMFRITFEPASKTLPNG